MWHRSFGHHLGPLRQAAAQRPVMCRFLDAGGIRPLRTLGRPASKKRQGAKSRQAGPAAGSRALWGFQVGVASGGGERPGRGDSGACTRRRARAWKERSGRGLRGIDGRRAPGLPGIGSRGIAAGVEPSQGNGKGAAQTGGLAHDVSNPPGVGRHLGSQPRAKTSMTIMRAPQRGHGQRSARGASGVTSGCGCGSATGGSATGGRRRAARGLLRCSRRGWHWRRVRNGGCGGSPSAARAGESAG